MYRGSKQAIAINLYYLNFAGILIRRPLLAGFSSGADTCDAALSPLVEAITQTSFADFVGALCEAFRLAFFACCGSFCRVVVSFAASLILRGDQRIAPLR